jgi:hypothetical protein
MVLLTRSRAVVELGQKLVEQLGSAEDLLSAWMAHRIAELIDAASNATPETKAAAEDACSEAILELWKHLSTLRRDLSPLEELEPILRTLTSLDVDRTKHRYFPNGLVGAEVTGVDEATKQWLDLAVDLDYSARLLVQFALCKAAKNAVSKAAPWVDLALQAGADEDAGVIVVKFVSEKATADDSQKDEEDSKLRERLSRLEAFAQLAAEVAKDLRAQLCSHDAREG